MAAEDKPRFIKGINNPTEQMFLSILTAPVTDIVHFRKELKKLELTENFKQAILKFKLKQFVEGTTGAPEQKILQ